MVARMSNDQADADKLLTPAEVAAFEADTCVRAAFDADAKAAITLVNARGTTLAKADGEEGTLGAAGPVCFKKGDVATFRFEGQSRLRLVIWASP